MDGNNEREDDEDLEALCVFNYAHAFGGALESTYKPRYRPSFLEHVTDGRPEGRTRRTSRSARIGRRRLWKHRKNSNISSLIGYLTEPKRNFRISSNRFLSEPSKEFRISGNNRFFSEPRKEFRRKRGITEELYLPSTIGHENLQGYLQQSSRKIVHIPEVVDTVQNAWSLENDLSKNYSEGRVAMVRNTHDDNSGVGVGVGVPLPILLRRRLSAPEIIMRKHTLAQQKSESLESESTQNSTPSTLRPLYSRSFWGRTPNSGSESNLSSRRTTGFGSRNQQDSMRRSTLLRRTWSKEHQPRKQIYSIDSIEPPKYFHYDISSPDHKTNASSISSKSEVVQESVYSEKTISRVSTSGSVNSTFYSSSSDIRTPGLSTTTSTETEYITTHTTANGDSAYNNSRTSEIVNSSNSEIGQVNVNNCLTKEYTPNTTQSSNIDNSDKQELPPQTFEIVSNINVNATTVKLIMNSDSENNQGYLSHNNANRTTEAKNNHKSFYLKRKDDVHITPEHCRIIKYMLSNIRAGSIYGKPFGDPPLVIPRYSAMPRSTSMEVNPSSPDSTDRESETASLVDSLDDPNSPRQSAHPSKSKHDDKPVRGDLSALLPDNSSSCRETPVPKPKLQKAAAFFIPMLSEDSIDKDVKSVAERMPDKVRDKLNKRKQRMEKKFSLKPIDSGYSNETSAKDSNGNQISIGVINSNFNQIRNKTENNNNSVVKRKLRTDKKLKEIHSKTVPLRVNNNSDVNSNTYPIRRLRRINKNKKKPLTSDENSETSSHSSSLRPTTLITHNRLSAPIPIPKNEYPIEPTPKPIYRKTEYKQSNKKVEILEIMEETSTGQLYHHSPRSRIPVLKNKTQENSEKLPHRTHYAYNITKTPEQEPKVDQLIANLLIDSLNKSDAEETSDAQEDHKRIEHIDKRQNIIISNKQHSNWYRQKFEMIPEEKTSMSQGSSNEDIISVISAQKKSDNNEDLIRSVEVETQVESEEFPRTPPKENFPEKSLIDASSQTDMATDYSTTEEQPPTINKGKAALSKTQDEDMTTIPKGWITFYMLRKNPGSPNSSTDEGAVRLTDMEGKKATQNIQKGDKEMQVGQMKPIVVKRKLGNKENSTTESSSLEKQIIKKEPNLISSCTSDSVIKSGKEQFTSSSDNSKSQTLSSDHESEKQSVCPSLPLSSYLPLRKNRRLNQRKNRFKIAQGPWSNLSEIPGEWSVTVSGMNTCGQPVPDLEMRLKFPTSQGTSQSDSGFGEDNPMRTRRQPPMVNPIYLPPTGPNQNKKYTVITKKQNDFLEKDLLNNKSFHYLPDLIKNKNQRIVTKRDEPAISSVTRSAAPAHVRMPPLGTSESSRPRPPRQTLTSYRRFSLHHSGHLPPHLRMLSTMPDFHPRNMLELPACFSGDLSVMGSAIPPENKPRVPKRDLNKNYTFQEYPA